MNEYEKAIFIVLIIVNLILFCKCINVENFFGNKCHLDAYNLEREIWGPHGWFFIHSVAFGYPENPSNLDKNNARKFIESLAYTIPCLKCQMHFRKNIKHLEPNLKSKYDFFKWTVDIHNEVNKDTGKLQKNVEDVYKYYCIMYDKEYDI